MPPPPFSHSCRREVKIKIQSVRGDLMTNGSIYVRTGNNEPHTQTIE